MVPNPKMQKTCPNNEPIRIRAPIKHLRHYIFRMLKNFAFVLVTISLLGFVLLYYYRLRRSMFMSTMNPIVLDANIFLLMT